MSGVLAIVLMGFPLTSLEYPESSLQLTSLCADAFLMRVRLPACGHPHHFSS
ncbi:Uncharacterised protein [Vibrio cholerae]|nr:Uncharacterised protein [Vibrio cholerae]CSI72591.1 Uncharacterised protein [Vibrio cholerae]